jgi:hypothetical protein
VSLTGGNRNDVHPADAADRGHPAGPGRRGRPRKRPDAVYADRGYDHDKYRRQVRGKGITPVIARRGTEHGSGLGVHRWVVEQSIALLHWFRRLRIRWEIRDGHPRGIPQPGLQHYLLAPPDEPCIVLGVLSQLPAGAGKWRRVIGSGELAPAGRFVS